MGTEPLPDGTVRLFRKVDTGLSYLGEMRTKYIPIGEKVEVPLGRERSINVERKLFEFAKSNITFEKRGREDRVVGWDENRTYKTEVANYLDRPAQVEIERTFSGDWEIDSDTLYERVDASTVKFVFTLPPRETSSFTYTVTNHMGRNMHRSGRR
jgi:hypothetical protein